MAAPFTDDADNRAHAFAWAVDRFRDEDMARAFVLHLVALDADDQDYVYRNGYQSEADYWAKTDTL